MRIRASDSGRVARKIVRESEKQDREGEGIMKSDDSDKVPQRVVVA